MKRVINREELKVGWQTEKWYEKVYYVVGIVTTWLWILGFIVGLVIGIAEG